MGIRPGNVAGNKGGTDLPPNPKELMEREHLCGVMFSKLARAIGLFPVWPPVSVAARGSSTGTLPT